MKHFYFSLFCLCGLFISNAQTLISDQPTNSTTGIISVKYGIGGSSVFCTDDFTASSNAVITDLTFEAFQSNAVIAPIFQGVELYIFGNGTGVPAGNPATSNSWLLFADIPAGDPSLTITDAGLGSDYNISIDLLQFNGTGFSVTAGTTYWVSIAAKVNDAFNAGAGTRWNWFAAAAAGGDAQIASPSGDFGLTPGTWASFPSLGLAVNGLNFLIEDNSTLSVNELSDLNFKIFPNPAQNFIRISTASGIQVEAVEAYDMLGKRLDLAIVNDEVDITHLTPGIYMLKVVTNSGSITKKIIKE
ncbi:MAG: T9SS type A sorting domain-containing protein [Flavobacteriaceae bacterium]|nr:T9SS type A sorting domain-containing protein [Flavobacteriaceae bacterium]